MRPRPSCRSPALAKAWRGALPGGAPLVGRVEQLLEIVLDLLSRAAGLLGNAGDAVLALSAHGVPAGCAGGVAAGAAAGAGDGSAGDGAAAGASTAGITAT